MHAVIAWDNRTKKAHKYFGKQALFYCPTWHIYRASVRLRLIEKKIAQRSSLWGLGDPKSFLAPLNIALWQIAGGVVGKGIDGRSSREVRPRTEFNFNNHFASLGTKKFKRLYRLSRESFREVHRLIEDKLKRTKIKKESFCRTLKARVIQCITMRILANAIYLDVGWPYGVGDTTVYELFQETLKALEYSRPRIKFPITEKECLRESLKFR